EMASPIAPDFTASAGRRSRTIMARSSIRRAERPGGGARVQGPATGPNGPVILSASDRCPSRRRVGLVRRARGLGGPASAISGADPGLVERGVLHALHLPALALLAGDEIAVDRVDGPVLALDDGRIVIGAAVMLLQVPGPLPGPALIVGEGDGQA